MILEHYLHLSKWGVRNIYKKALITGFILPWLGYECAWFWVKNGFTKHASHNIIHLDNYNDNIGWNYLRTIFKRYEYKENTHILHILYYVALIVYFYFIQKLFSNSCFHSAIIVFVFLQKVIIPWNKWLNGYLIQKVIWSIYV